MNKKGQAVIEYILLLVIIVALVLLVMARILTPFKNYFVGVGSYVSCLLEYGELPSFGSTGEAQAKIESSSSASGKACKAKFVMADAKNSSGGGGNGGGGTSQNGENQGASGASKGGKNSSSSSSDSSGAGYSDAGGGSGGSFGNLNSRSSRKARSGGDRDPEVVVVNALNNDSSGTRSSTSNGWRGPSSQRRFVVGIKGELQEEVLKKAQKNRAGSVKSVPMGEGGNISQPLRKFSVKAPPEKIKSEDDSTPIGIGWFLRILFIAAIVILLIVLIGGQALQISKNWEK